MEALSLLELNALVRRSLEQCLPDEYWVQAELSDVRTNSTGHCYLEFIQKDPRSNGLVAKARGTIWSNVYRLLKPYFEEATGQAFVSGIKVLVQVTVSFHELYGYSLTVQDIDPTYTLGDMARRRREILKQLEEEGALRAMLRHVILKAKAYSYLSDRRNQIIKKLARPVSSFIAWILGIASTLLAEYLIRIIFK